MAATDNVAGVPAHAGDISVASGAEGDRLSSDRDAGEQVVTLAEERATITRRVVETGLVRVRTETEEVEHVEHATLGLERVEVEHHPVNAWVDAMPEVRKEGDVTIVPLVEERLVVEKRLFVTEEIHIRRVRSTETVDVPVTLRRQHAVVERLAPAAGTRERPDSTDIDLNK